MVYPSYKEVTKIEEFTRSRERCFRCKRNIPFRHSYWEGINSNSKTHWEVVYCPRCGTVTFIEEIPFHYSNLLPRIGKVKSFLFVNLIGLPFYLIAWLIGGLGPGIGISTLILLTAVFVTRCKIHEVVDCPYREGESYPELVRS